MIEKLVFTVPGNAVPKGRPKFARRGGYVSTYTPTKTREYESLVRQCWELQCGGRKIEGRVPLAMEVHMHFDIPKSVSKKKHRETLGKPHVVKPDCDNAIKSITDAISGYAFEDDAQIAWLFATKDYQEEARTEVIVRVMEVDDDKTKISMQGLSKET